MFEEHDITQRRFVILGYIHGPERGDHTVTFGVYVCTRKLHGAVGHSPIVASTRPRRPRRLALGSANAPRAAAAGASHGRRDGLPGPFIFSQESLRGRWLPLSSPLSVPSFKGDVGPHKVHRPPGT